jgi:hypothetical protein
MLLTDNEVKEVIKKYAFGPEEMYPKGKILLISLTGIKKIIQKEKYNVAQEIMGSVAEGFVVTCQVSTGDQFHTGYRSYTAIGEASSLNTEFKFPASVASSRAVSRAVLMMAELSHRGVLGEAELDEETQAAEIMAKRKTQVNEATQNLLGKIKKS